MLLEAKEIGFRYGKGPWVLKGVNLTIQEGEVVGLYGPSGFGKSTLARILAGFEKPHEGFVKLRGEDLPTRGYSPVQLVFQHPEKAVNPRWRVSETLREGWEPTEQLLADLGIEPEWLRRWPNELSGGELQRFCVARALGPKTQVLIADEMTTMLDAITQAQIWQVVLEVTKRENMGLLVISHEAGLMKRICTRVVKLTELNKAKY